VKLTKANIWAESLDSIKKANHGSGAENEFFGSVTCAYARAREGKCAPGEFCLPEKK